MKRCRIGAAGLVLLLILGLGCSAWMGQQFRESAQQMALAAGAEPEAAMAIAQTVRRSWERRRTLYGLFCDHTPLQEVDMLFSILDPEAENFRETCIRLSRALEALGRSQQVSAENVF